MTGPGDLRFTDAKAQIDAGRRFLDSDTKHVRFGATKGLYLHRGFSGMGATAAAGRLAKQQDGAKMIFQSIANEFNEEIARELFRRVTGSAEPKTLRLGELDVMQEIIKTNPTTRRLAAAKTSAKLDGEMRTKNHSPEFLDKIENRGNEGIKRTLQQKRDWKDGVFGGMSRDMGRAKYIVRGRKVSDPRDRTLGNAAQQQKESRDRLINSGIPAEHLPVLSAYLHQGLFADHMTETYDNPQDAPMPFLFGDGMHKSDRVAGNHYEVRRADKDGVYDFVAISNHTLGQIQDLSKKGQLTQDRTDDTRSQYTIQFAGQIDVDNHDKPLTLTRGQVGYAGVPRPEGENKTIALD